jgi:hypothetical protein
LGEPLRRSFARSRAVSGSSCFRASTVITAHEVAPSTWLNRSSAIGGAHRDLRDFSTHASN